MRPIYEGEFKTDPYGGLRYYRAVTRDERGYAIYAGHRQWFPPNNGATIDDYQHGGRRCDW